MAFKQIFLKLRFYSRFRNRIGFHNTDKNCVLAVTATLVCHFHLTSFSDPVLDLNHALLSYLSHKHTLVFCSFVMQPHICQKIERQLVSVGPTFAPRALKPVFRRLPLPKESKCLILVGNMTAGPFHSLTDPSD